MTEAEENDLRALGNALSGALQSPWEPRCIAETFRSADPALSLVFTMQHWIDLEAMQSPLLRGEIPEVLEDVHAAALVFALEISEASAEEQVLVAEEMRDAIAAAFALALPMRHPAATGSPPPDGFGSWLPVFAFLLAECHQSRAEALACPVGQAFALLAAVRRNAGWECAGTPYQLRDVENLEPETLNQKPA